MCGICGIVRFSGGIETRSVDAMCEAIRHRGPDDGGAYASPARDCVLGSRRLAIIDLTPVGHQPMSEPGGRFWITYNGEVYNFVELRAELEARGHRFRSRTDTEVVLHVYQEYGERCVERLNGLFAFAIWDQQERSLFLARDRFGIKPLYYSWAGESFLFGSEIRAILASGLVPARADSSAVAGYLMMGSVPDDRTILLGVESLAPGHCATLRPAGLTVRQYWSHADELRRAIPLPSGEAEEAVRDGMKAAVRRQMVSDAPLGLFLSGGMDSTMLAALMRAVGHERIRSVSVSFDESAFDEGRVARRVADRFGLEHVDTRVTFQDFETHLDQIVRAMDQPTADGINTYFVSMAARQAGLTVALSGLGADELFGGYPSFSVIGTVQRAMRGLARIPGREQLVPLLNALPGIPRGARKLARWSNGSASLADAYLAVRGLLSPEEVRSLIGSPRLPDPAAYAGQVASIDGLPEMAGISVLESRVYMHNQLLRDTDAMSMAHSLEVRVPFLDNEIATLAARCSHLLGGPPKAVLAGARSIYFPLGLQDRAKQGFTFPLEAWLAGPLAARVEHGADSGGVSAPEMRRLWTEFRGGRRHWAQVWAPMLLNHWLDAHHVTVAG